MSLFDYRDTLEHQKLLRALTFFEKLQLWVLNKWVYLNLTGCAPMGFSREAKAAVQELKRRLQ